MLAQVGGAVGPHLWRPEGYMDVTGPGEYPGPSEYHCRGAFRGESSVVVIQIWRHCRDVCQDFVGYQKVV